MRIWRSHESFLALLKQHGADDVKLVIGGIIPEQDRGLLIEMGVRAVFTPKDSSLGAIVERIVAISAD